MKKVQTMHQAMQIPQQNQEYFSRNEDFNFAGTHLLLELWQAQNLSSIEIIEEALIQATKACNATLREIRLHHFSPYQGISGVAIIQESHISIHTWPELAYAAVDVFMCGKAEPAKSIAVFKSYFKPKRVQILELKRGLFDNAEMVL